MLSLGFPGTLFLEELEVRIKLELEIKKRKKDTLKSYPVVSVNLNAFQTSVSEDVIKLRQDH